MQKHQKLLKCSQVAFMVEGVGRASVEPSQLKGVEEGDAHRSCKSCAIDGCKLTDQSSICYLITDQLLLLLLDSTAYGPHRDSATVMIHY